MCAGMTTLLRASKKVRLGSLLMQACGLDILMIRVFENHRLNISYNTSCYCRVHY